MKIRVNEYNLESSKLEQEYDILAISDIHSNIDVLRYIKYLLTEKTEYLTICGDILNHIESSKKNDLIQELQQLSTYVNVFISLGNHDNIFFYKDGIKNIDIPTNDLSFFDILKRDTNCIVMTNEIETHILDRYRSISAINMPTVWYEEGENINEFDQMLSKNSINLDEEKFNILLLHTPNTLIRDNQLIHSSKLKNIDLVLSGHNHGGLTPMFIQNISKNHRGIVGPYGKIKQPNSFGYWTTEDASLILSNGITKIATTSEDSFLSSMLNRLFIPDVELIHATAGDKHKVQLKKRIIHHLSKRGK